MNNFQRAWYENTAGNQLALFDLGYTWATGIKKVQYLHAEFLLTDKDGTFTFRNSVDAGWKKGTQLGKTIRDAVIDLKGDLGNCEKGGKHHRHIAYSKKQDRFLSIYIADAMPNSIVCTIDEFNALVDEMASNFGRCSTTFEQYKLDYALNKSKSPTRYTQEMADNDVKPSVGMVVSLSVDVPWTEVVSMVQGWIDSSVEVTIKSKFKLGESELFVVSSDDCFSVVTLDCIEPVEDEVVLIDGEAYQFEVSGNEFSGIYRVFDNSFYNYHGSERVSYCKNIKRLTVSE